jgi:hypothetical protein
MKRPVELKWVDVEFHDRRFSDCSVLNGRFEGVRMRTPTLVFILEESLYGPLKRFVSAAALLIYNRSVR